MGFSIVAYNSLQLGTYELTNLLELNMVKTVNDHVRLYFTGIIPEEQRDKYVEMTKVQTQVEVNYKNKSDESKTLFKGIVINIKVKMVRSIYYLEAEAVSHTYNMDVKLLSRSFQDKNMKYKDMVKSVISHYSNADVIDTVSKEAKIKKFIMQYKETDWEFLKRMASHFNVGLVASASVDTPKFWFGTPNGEDRGSLSKYFYTVTKKISDFRYSSENYIAGITEDDFTYYEIETEDFMEIGDKVDFNSKKLFVCRVETSMKDGVLMHQYVLTPEKGLSQNTVYNNKIIGLSVEGRVISVAKDNVKIHMEIDKSQDVGKAWWFPYSSVYTAEGNSGWYCMPEINDHVRVYFQNNKEEDSVAISSVRKDTEKGETNKLDNPDVKYFRTKSGKELMFAPDEILISAKDGEIFIKLNENNGIEIKSTKEIEIKADENIIIGSKQKILITADEEVNITSKSSNVKLEGTSGNITIGGSEVRTN